MAYMSLLVAVTSEDVFLVRTTRHEQRANDHGHDRNHDGVPQARVDVAGLRRDGKGGRRY